MTKYSQCQKCGTKWSEVFEYNGQWLCKSNCCLQEEVEKNSGKAERDEKYLEEYRNLIAGSKFINPSVYQE